MCFLHSYRNAAHERAVGRALARAPARGARLAVVGRAARDARVRAHEHDRRERVRRAAHRALSRARCAARWPSASVRAPLLVMQSNGGLISASSAAHAAGDDHRVGSGRRRGRRAARSRATCGYPNVITLDMGGTTTKASIIERGEILRGTEYEVGSRGVGEQPADARQRLSAAHSGDRHLGGRRGRRQHRGARCAAGRLRVGPRSAGAVPGPACYGQGNDKPTVTDANLLLGYISGRRSPAARCRSIRTLAENAVRTPRRATRGAVAARRGARHPRGGELEHGARDQVGVGRARPRSRRFRDDGVRRGRTDPRGGRRAHARDPARSSIPPAPGVFSALGLLRAEIEHHAARTVLIATGGAADLAPVEAVLAEMRDDLLAARRARKASIPRHAQFVALGRSALSRAVVRAHGADARRTRSTRPRCARSRNASSTSSSAPTAIAATPRRSSSSRCGS